MLKKITLLFFAYLQASIALSDAPLIWGPSGTARLLNSGELLGRNGDFYLHSPVNLIFPAVNAKGPLLNNGSGTLSWLVGTNSSFAGFDSSGTMISIPGMTFTPAGNVGIGVAPLSKLDVVGGISAGAYAGINAAPTNGMIISGSVGIGTSSPLADLHVFDNVAVTAAHTGMLHTCSNTSSTASIAKVGLNVQSTGTWNGASATNTGLIVNATGGTTNYAATFSGGNVGIGIASPQVPLEVITTNTGAITAFRVLATTNSGGGNSTVASVGVQSTSKNAAEVAFTYAGSGSNSNNAIFRINGTTGVVVGGSGNVGIATTAPAAPLHIAGTSAILGTGEGGAPSAALFRGSNGGGTDRVGGAMTIQASNGTGAGGSGAISFQTAPVAASGSTVNVLATVMTITPSARVGIGSTSPAQLLDVASKFQVDTNGNILKINNIATSFPGSQGAASSYLQNNGAGVLTWAAVATPTLQNVYDADVDGGDATITTNVTDGSVAIAGTESLKVSATLGLNMTDKKITSTTTGQRIFLAPNGNGALVAESTTSVVGNGRGPGAVDLQLSKTLATHVASAESATIGGGSNNTSSGINATVGGGYSNVASAERATVGGGSSNTASQTSATIGGGSNNLASGVFAAIGGGDSNTASGTNATVPGGLNNRAVATGVTAMGYGAWANVAHDLVVGNNPSAGIPTTAANVHFRIAGDTSDVHIGRLTDQSAVAGAANKLSLHTILASNQSRAISIKASDTLTASYDMILPASQGAASTVLTNDGSGVLTWSNSGSTVNVTTTASATVGQKIMTDSSGGAFTITLPASATLGDVIEIFDATDSWTANNVTLGRNGLNINGAAADFVLNISGNYVRLIYYTAGQGWRTYP